MLVPPRKLRTRDFTRNLRFQLLLWQPQSRRRAKTSAMAMARRARTRSLPQNDTPTFLSGQARGGVTSFQRAPSRRRAKTSAMATALRAPPGGAGIRPLTPQVTLFAPLIQREFAKQTY